MWLTVVFFCLQGNNETCINTLVSEDSVTSYLTFHEALLCAENDKLHPQLRSCYIQLIIVMFVDCGNNQPFLDQLPYSFVSVIKPSILLLYAYLHLLLYSFSTLLSTQ